MNIELKNIKYVASMSEETSCFQAIIYIDGVKAGDARNDGHGGSTFISPLSLAEKLNEYGATLPVKVIDMGDGTSFDSKQDAESLVDDLLTKHLIEKDLRKLLTKRMIYTKKNTPGVMQTKVLTPADLQKYLSHPELKEKWQIDQILNTLPFEEALKIFTEKA